MIFDGLPFAYDSLMPSDVALYDGKNEIIYVRDRASAEHLVQALNNLQKGIDSSVDAAFLSMLGIVPDVIPA